MDSKSLWTAVSKVYVEIPRWVWLQSEGAAGDSGTSKVRDFGITSQDRHRIIKNYKGICSLAIISSDLISSSPLWYRQLVHTALLCNPSSVLLAPPQLPARTAASATSTPQVFPLLLLKPIALAWCVLQEGKGEFKLLFPNSLVATVSLWELPEARLLWGYTWEGLQEQDWSG